MRLKMFKDCAVLIHQMCVIKAVTILFFYLTDFTDFRIFGQKNLLLISNLLPLITTFAP